MTDEINRIVGERLRAARMLRKMSQTTLGNLLGVSFQQVQKYERGANRISCSMLLQAAKALHCPVMSFFDGMDPLAAQSSPAHRLPFDTTADAYVDAYLALPSNRRPMAVEVVRALGKAA